ncbi:Acetolactate synthase small subunit, mitochondrial [Zancudomyces culisetae]|uniref:Acetolactate synthase small subunit, mitochondrial n=1 Tax=Zancudomyces culisetae TaxID=1213189 RepID=A0A1R1PW78_ZANCU|nr:Acetolactate synthase small subunit, mitochondrial [Zancudomyces culisetae]|eukprot:OMH85221.1 Acetolactate synthase small subunit, mitochondrial [Zancudomyces culisetae]
MDPARRAEAMAEQFVNAQERLKAIKILADLFEARVADVGADSIVIEMFAKITRLDAFLELIRPFGILEAVRGGTMVMTRSSLARAPGELGSSAEAEQELPEEAVGEVPDLSHLPPS